ncbi:M23 family metallopeptidase [Saccharopolyspora griseoalba]|uniref:M23 family metallopeptidase n=1 Tax=Saccharopolyspora griseoalba TaxID=1431848 RepID=A0ABW2LGM0_9PSEU
MRALIPVLLCCALIGAFAPAVAAGHRGGDAADRGGAAAGVPALSWPLDPPPAPVRPFEPPEHAYGPGHRGVDLAGASGQPVLAAADGVVVFAGRLADRELVSLEHTGGLRTSYEPVHPLVETGQRVSRGQPIGRLQPGHCPEPCLHWGARVDDAYVDPLGLLGGGRVRLLPW